MPTDTVSASTLKRRDHDPPGETGGPRERALLWALLFGNFVVGTGVLVPAGMLTELADGLSVSVPVAGYLMLASGAIVAIGAPLVAGFTSHVDRRLLLVFSLVLYAVSHVVSAMATDFGVVFAARCAMAISAAIFTPQAAATVGALLGGNKRSAAITFVFVGWSMATVGGIPLGGYLAHAYGWQTPFALIAVMAALAAAAVYASVPRGVKIAPLNVQSWRQVLNSQALMTMLLVTVLNGTGQFTFFTYLNPSLKASLGGDATLLTALLALYGISATVGNIIASRMVSRFGAARAVMAAITSMAVGLSIWGLGADVILAVAIGATLWGLGTFATNSMQQARLASEAPEVTSASIALNTSAIYLGQALGAALGGQMISAGYLAVLPLAAAAILVVAAFVSKAAERFEGRGG